MVTAREWITQILGQTKTLALAGLGFSLGVVLTIPIVSLAQPIPPTTYYLNCTPVAEFPAYETQTPLPTITQTPTPLPQGATATPVLADVYQTATAFKSQQALDPSYNASTLFAPRTPSPTQIIITAPTIASTRYLTLVGMNIRSSPANLGYKNLVGSIPAQSYVYLAPDSEWVTNDGVEWGKTTEGNWIAVATTRGAVYLVERK